MMTLLECGAAGIAVRAAGSENIVAGDLTVRFLSPVRVGPARVVGRALRAGRRSIVVLADVIDIGADRKLCASASVGYARLDDGPAIAERGTGAVTAAVVSMSERHADGRDAAYLEWHMLDHLPEQYRLPGLRSGLRFVSTPECRAARAASVAPFDTVDHIVQYLFTDPVEPALEAFFSLGAALRAAGRMPIALPRVQVGGWNAKPGRRRRSGPRGGCSAAVATDGGRLCRGRTARSGRRSGTLRRARTPRLGARGCRRMELVGCGTPAQRLETTAGLALIVCYLDGSPTDVASGLAPVLEDRWAGGRLTPLLAGPFEVVVPGEWDRHLP